MSSGRETFAQAPEAYAQARPIYPPALYTWLAERVTRRELAWDCGTGNGQAAVGLAAHFARVHASDLAAEQIAHATPHPRIHYATHPAEVAPLGDGEVDLVAVAQALHWFDFAPFWREVARVAHPGAYFCAWGYAWLECEAERELHTLLLDPVREILAPHWAPQNRLLWEGYPSRAIAFPFRRDTTPAFAIELQWSAGALLAYLRTWSAYKRAQADPTAAAALARVFSAAETRWQGARPFALHMPLFLVAGRIDRSGG